MTENCCMLHKKPTQHRQHCCSLLRRCSNMADTASCMLPMRRFNTSNTDKCYRVYSTRANSVAVYTVQHVQRCFIPHSSTWTIVFHSIQFNTNKSFSSYSVKVFHSTQFNTSKRVLFTRFNTCKSVPFYTVQLEQVFHSTQFSTSKSVSFYTV